MKIVGVKQLGVKDIQAPLMQQWNYGFMHKEKSAFSCMWNPIQSY